MKNLSEDDKPKTLTTSFMDFTGGQQNHILGELNRRLVAHPNKDGTRYWVREHIANTGLYPASSLADLLPDGLRRLFFRSCYTMSRERAIICLQEFEKLPEAPSLKGEVIIGYLNPPSCDIHVNTL